MTNGSQQPQLFEDDPDARFNRALRTGNYADIVAAAGRRLLEAIDSPECDHDTAVALLRDVLPDPPEDYDPRPFIAANTWTYAKTSEHPHEYLLLRNSADWREHLRFLRWLRVFGEVERWLDGHRYRYRLVDGWRYWAMFSPNDTILNRRREPTPERESEDHDAAVARLLAARIEQGLGPTITDPKTLDKAAVLFGRES
jgi:hypothetical protein